MIDEGPHLHLRRQLRCAANVIAMVVGDQRVVDLLHARGFCRRSDAIRVAPTEPRKAGIDEERLARRRHDERRLPAFDVDEVDLQRLRSAECCAGHDRCRESDKFCSVFAAWDSHGALVKHKSVKKWRDETIARCLASLNEGLVIPP